MDSPNPFLSNRFAPHGCVGRNGGSLGSLVVCGPCHRLPDSFGLPTPRNLKTFIRGRLFRVALALHAARVIRPNFFPGTVPFTRPGAVGPVSPTTVTWPAQQRRSSFLRPSCMRRPRVRVARCRASPRRWPAGRDVRVLGRPVLLGRACCFSVTSGPGFFLDTQQR